MSSSQTTKHVKVKANIGAAAAAGVMKKPAAARRVPLTTRRCLAMLVKLEATGDIPDSAWELVAQIKRLAKSHDREKQHSAVAMLGKLLTGVLTTLQTSMQEKKAVVDGSDEAREALAAEQAAAESKVAELKQLISEKKVALRNAAKAIAESNKAVASAKAGQKRAMVDLNKVESKKRRVESVETDVYRPLRDASVEGSAAKKQVKSLCTLGKEYGFHKELLSIVPPIIKKPLDKRQTFDGQVLQSLDAEFAKLASTFTSTVMNGEAAVAEQSVAVEEAREILNRSKQQQKADSRALSQAEADLDRGKTKIAEARQHIRNLPADHKRATNELERAVAKINKFQKGPFAAYERLQASQTADKRIRDTQDTRSCTASSSNAAKSRACKVATGHETNQAGAIPAATTSGSAHCSTNNSVGAAPTQVESGTLQGADARLDSGNRRGWARAATRARLLKSSRYSRRSSPS